MQRLLLDTTAPTYLGGRFRTESAIDDDYRRFPELLRTGETWPRSDHGAEMLAALADSSTPDATMIIDHVLVQLPGVVQRLSAGGEILEIGAGGGVHAVHFATAFTETAVVAIESDSPSVAMARERITRHGLADRVHIRHQDATELADHDRYDLATMNLVLHETGGPDDQRAVLQRTFTALQPGGVIVVSELPYPDDIASYRSNPDHRRLAGLQLHEAVVGCGAITQLTLLALVGDAGFDDVHTVDQPRSSRYVVVGTKPSR